MLITPTYLEEQKRLHADDPTYACTGHKWAYLVTGIAILEECYSILDYGSGKGTLGIILRNIMVGESGRAFWVHEYDPVGDSHDVRPVNLVTCTDVMEHVEPECLEAVLADLARVTERLLFLVISTKFDKGRTLSDGRNAHLIVNDGPWWQAKFEAKGFKLKREWNTGVKEWVALMEKV